MPAKYKWNDITEVNSFSRQGDATAWVIKEDAGWLPKAEIQTGPETVLQILGVHKNSKTTARVTASGLTKEVAEMKKLYRKDRRK